MMITIDENDHGPMLINLEHVLAIDKAPNGATRLAIAGGREFVTDESVASLTQRIGILQERSR